MKTEFFKINPNRIYLSANKRPIGRLANEISQHLMGKNNFLISPITDVNSTIFVKDLDKAILKNEHRIFSHSGFPSGSKIRYIKSSINNSPSEYWKFETMKRFLFKVVRGMLPKTKNYKNIVFKRVKIMKSNITLVKENSEKINS